MTEKINVLTVQREISDFSLVNEIDRQNDLFNFAKLAGIDRVYMVPFIRLFESYKPAPDVTAMPEILLNYILTNNDGRFVPDIDLNITNSSNKPWEYFIPKDIPKDSIRINTPMRTMVKLGSNTLYIPKGQLMDYKVEDIRSEFDTFMFVPILTKPTILRCISKKDRLVPISNLIPIKIDNNDLMEFMQLFKDDGVSIRDKYYYMEMVHATLMNMGLSTIYSTYLKEDEAIFSRALSQYVLRYKGALIDKKNQRLVVELKLQKKIMLSFIPKDIKYDPIWSINKIMSLLTPEMQNYVKSAYKARQEFIDASMKNTCPHIHEYFLSRNAPTIQRRRRAYNKLKSFISMGSNKEDTGWLTCKNCSFNALCPHVKVLIEAELNDIKYSDTLSKLDMYVNHDAMDNSDSDTKYCKICSEHIPSMSDISAGSDQYRDTYKDINSKLWAYSNVIYGHLKFNPLVNVQDFAILITNNILPVIATIDAMGDGDLISVMNNYIQSGEISPKLDLYIWLFIYAYVLHMIRENITNPSPHHIKVRLVNEAKAGRNMAAYAEALFIHIKTNHRGLIDYVKSDSYEDMFKRAYTLLANSNIQFAIERMYSRAYELFTFMLNSTHFHFTYDIYNLMNEPVLITIEEYEKAIEAIIGETMIEASKKTDVAALKDIPKVNVMNDAIKPDVKVDMNNYNKYYKSIVLRTYDVYYKWFHDSISTESGLAYKLFDQLKHYDRIGRDIKRYKYRIVSNSFECEKAYRRHIYTHPYELTSIINKNGDVYNWDVIVYNDGTEVPRGTKLDKPKMIIDYKSSKLGILRSKTDEIDKRVVIDKYLYNNNIKDFFTFYEVLCPEDGIHTYDDKEICTKCHYNKSLRDNQPSYYEKYKPKFDGEMKVITTDVINTKNIDHKPTGIDESSYVLITQDDRLITEDVKGYIKQAEQWKYNNLSILDVSRLINIRQDVMFYLGAMSGLTYKYVMNAATSDNAPKPTVKTSSQISLLYGSYLNISSLYNLIRISNNIDPLYKPILNKYPNSIALASKLKIDGCIKYSMRIDVVKSKESAESIYLCILQSICELIMDVVKTGSDEFYSECGKYLMQNILKEQTSYCKAVEPDVGLIRKRKDINLQEKVEYDRIYEEEYDVADLQMFVNDSDYTGYNDTLE